MPLHGVAVFLRRGMSQTRLPLDRQRSCHAVANAQQERPCSGYLRNSLCTTRSAFHASWAVGHQRGIDLQRPRTGLRPRISANDRNRFQHDSGKRVFSRADTCQGPVVRILFVGFLRPEKGIEYLLHAVSQLKLDVPWELEIVGPRQFPDYCKKLDEIAAALGICERIRWEGYVPNGKPLFDRMRAADLLVLPTLSEGTPHVLVEARANGLPCISTTVGGVPTTVTDRYDALLVPPKDATALARAMELVVGDAELRRALIRNGLLAARKQTLDRFIATVVRELDANVHAERAAVPQE
jgi:glycosyltransferase involved in cell wall biosynthesis